MPQASLPQGHPGAQPFATAHYPGIANKVVLNTGAGSGIGRAMAHAFARHGAKLMLLDLDAAGLAETRAQLTDAFPDVEVDCVQASITDDAAVEQACAATQARFGQIDILLNNAGISMNKPSLELTPAEWRRVIDIDLTGTFYCAQAAGKRMAAQRSGGVILSTASIWGLSTAGNRLGYCVAKAGVVSLTKCLAAEWAQHRIRVNAICPGYTQTSFVDAQIEQGRLDGATLCAKTPMNRFGRPEEMAEAALYLASDAAAFVTGHALVSDGGWLADGYY